MAAGYKKVISRINASETCGSPLSGDLRTASEQIISNLRGVLLNKVQFEAEVHLMADKTVKHVP